MPPDGKKIGFNLLDDEYFTAPCVIDTIQFFSAYHQNPTQANKNGCIIYINGEESITAHVALDKIQHHTTPHGKSKVNVRLFRRKSYHSKVLEEIQYRFDQFIPMVSHIDVHLPNKPLSLKRIGEALKGTQRPLRK